MNDQLPIYLVAGVLLGSPLLAQNAPAPQPVVPPPAAVPRDDNPPRRDDVPRAPRAERPIPPGPDDGGGPPPSPGGARDPFGPPPGGGPPGGGPRGGGPRYGPRDPRGEAPEGERPPIRTDRVPDGYARPPGFGGDRPNPYESPAKPTPYIGVVTSPVSPALAAQLGLNEGFGLVIEDVLPDSPAQSAGLQRYDVLKLANDQQLADPGQLAGLLRGLGKDTEVTITFIRKGQEQKVPVKIGEKKLPERRPGFDLQHKLGVYGVPFGLRDQGAGPRAGGEGGQFGPRPDPMHRMQEYSQRLQEYMRQYQERLRAWQKDRSAPIPEPPPAPEPPPIEAPAGPADLLREARPGGASQLRLTQPDGVSTFQTNRARIGMKDGDGEIEIVMHDGQRTLTAKNPGGEVVFTGPIDTPGQREAVPAPLRAKLEIIEAQQRQFPVGRGSGGLGSRDAVPFPPPPMPLPSEPEVQ